MSRKVTFIVDSSLDYSRPPDTMVNPRGTMLIDYMQDIPNCARVVAYHGVRQGVAVALAVA